MTAALQKICCKHLPGR